MQELEDYLCPGCGRSSLSPWGRLVYDPPHEWSYVIAYRCPDCINKLLAWLNENLEVVKAHDPDPHVPRELPSP